MKHLRSFVAACLIFGAAAGVADAQVGFRYRRQGKNYVLDIWYGGGYGYGYGYGYSPGFAYAHGNSSYSFGTNFHGGNAWRSAGYDAYYGTPYGHGYGPRYGTRSEYADYAASNVYRRGAQQGSPEHVRRLTVDKHLELGMRKWKVADYPGALASFKEAVGVDTSGGLAQVWMALALVATGDPRNADKAAESGLAALVVVQELRTVDLKSQFRDAKEQAKFSAALERSGPLAAALACAVLGDATRAKEKAAAAGSAGQRLMDYLK